MRGIGAGRAALAVAAVLVAVVGVVAPAHADSADSTLTVSGRLLVVTDTGAELAIDAGETPTSPLPEDRTYSLVTDEGQVIALDGEFPESATSGDRFEGSVSIPDQVAADLEVAPGEVVESDSALGAEVVDAATTVEVPLVVQSSDVFDAPVDGAAVAAAHTMDVAIVSNAMPTGSVAALTAPVGSYWVSQSNGQISSFAQNPTVRSLTAACPASSSAQNALWTSAASAFGATVNTYVSGSGRHLVVILPSSCNSSTGTGLGSIGGSIHQGGVLFVSNYLDVAPVTLAHEIGHNLSLGHGNLSYCGTADYDEGAGCSTYEYNDMYSIMGYAIADRGSALPALPASQRDWLAAFPSADLALQPGPSGNPVQRTTYVLKPISDTSGLRGIRVTDPLTGSVYYVELRSGTGTDSGAFYTEGYRWGVGGVSGAVGTGSGVRVLQLNTSNLAAKGAQATALSVVTSPSQPQAAYAALPAGEDFWSRSGGLHIEVLSLTPNTSTPTSASVRVTSGGWTGTSAAPSVTRISGSDRFAVGVGISQQAYPDPAHVPVVYVTTGYNFPDALSAAPAATKFGGPLLLTEPAALPAAVRDEVVRLNPARIVVVGGPASVSPAVFDDLNRIAPTTRLGGGDRYEASRAIVRDAWLTRTTGGARSVYIATGANFPDALSASGAGGAFDMPVILVQGTDATLDSATRQLLIELGVTSIKIAGGPGSVSPGIMAALNSIKPTVRLSGNDRFEASSNVAVDAFASTPPTDAYLATGYNFPDALAGAAIAGARSAPLIVVPTDCIPPAVLTAFDRWSVDRVTLLGGPASLTPRVGSLLSC